MKKQLTAVLLVFAFLLTMAGCSAAKAVQKLDAAEDVLEAKLDAVEEQVESSLRKAVTPDRSAASAGPVPTPTEALPEPTVSVPAPAETLPLPASPTAESSRGLTEDQALQIALDYLGLTAQRVTRLRTHQEIDDGIPQFDVEFHQGDWEYEFEIHAENGQILSYDKDHKYD